MMHRCTSAANGGERRSPLRAHAARGLTVVLLLATVAHAAEQAPQPAFASWVYPCPKVTSAPTIDGKLDDDAYSSAPIAGGFVDYHNPSQYIKPTTTFQVAHDGKTLYFAFRCEEPQMADLEARKPRGRDAVAAIGETVEIFLDLNHDHDSYHQWIISLNRDLYDADRTDKSWDSQVNFAVHRGNAHWGMEIAIPLEQVGLKGPLQTWHVSGFRVCRNRWRSLESGRWWSSWSAGGFHDPSTYDHLVICDEEGLIPQEKLAELMPVFRRDNDQKTGPVLVAAATGPNGESFAELGRRKAQRLETHLTQLEQVVTILRERAGVLRTAVNDLHGQAEALNAGTYPVFSLEVDRMVGQTEDAFWASRKQALMQMLRKQ
jgi:hypothetical protein